MIIITTTHVFIAVVMVAWSIFIAVCFFRIGRREGFDQGFAFASMAKNPLTLSEATVEVAKQTAMLNLLLVDLADLAAANDDDDFFWTRPRANVAGCSHSVRSRDGRTDRLF